MLFNSVAFIVFFIVVHQVFWRIPNGPRKYWLLLASIVFYGFWSVPFLLHFLGAVALSYGFLLALRRRRHPAILAAIISILVGNLLFFKYTNSVLTLVAEQFHMPAALLWCAELGLVLPLAISFYTFQIIAFIVDYWRGEIKELNFVDFAVFILFFPQLIAGPIMRHHEFLGQLDRPTQQVGDNARGIYRILLGVIKKVLIADQIGAMINPLWANPEALDALSATVAVLGFVGQIYCDFSGYTDMARGMALLLGYRIPENFFAPYLATSFTELWRRWHVTLATWLRDYLYFPLGGSRVSTGRLYANIMIVMCLGGLWHGNSYNFFFWGFWSGLCLIGEKMLSLDGPARNRITAVVSNIGVMFAWCVGAVFFRAPDLATVFAVAEAFMDVESFARNMQDQEKLVLQFYCIALLLQAARRYKKYYADYLIKYSLVLVPLLTVLTYFMIARIENPTAEFYYFQF
ncbi:MAG: MBOAT family O-acyltransferase [Leptospirales bacterium]|jgi:alginate O-acetyltransferase complex protein AlgI